MLSLHPLSRDLTAVNMATKFVAAAALLALCHANPVLVNGIVFRDGRAYSLGQATSYGNGVSTAQANVHGDAAQAFVSASGGAGLARDAYYFPGQALAQAQTYDAPPFPESAYGAAKAVAQAHNGAYYPVPAPATVITYEQRFAPGASSTSHADSHGAGVAQSSANTRGVGGYGVTSSNANSQGEGSADSTANSGLGATSSSAKTLGEGSASSSAQSNGVAGVLYPAVPAALADQPAPAVIDAKSPVYYTSYVPVVPAQGVASSNANVVGSGSAASSARVGQGQGRTISWRFGTFYDAPASAQAQANTQSGYGAAKSAAHTHGYGAANANADVSGYGAAKSVADSHSSGLGVAQSSANSHGAGSANANANVNSAGYGGARSSADVHGQYYGGSRSSADAHSHGFGNAASSARTQGVNTALRVTNSQAKSYGSGSAHANAVSA
ncbi:hypothetical protein PYW07_006937 [Mythimna separata]|uniref:Uncharacterized protein n=1 Tax=Mythimna separata TaxID=271217 RepID=A0AAD7Z108_MYTSE|nr:hypothetical protein PYW07_006937 [Mythimna separata]